MIHAATCDPPADPELREIAETAIDALNDGDLEAFLAVVTHDVEFTSMIAEVEGIVFRGHEGVRAWWKSVRAPFEDVRWELLDLTSSGRRAVAKLRAVAVLGGVEVEQTVWQAATFRGDRLEWWAFFRDEREALGAAGLPLG
ncbi:MAG TPA: nuclear transport factor 2 family protein [Thermoleophilaceae bacterium]